MTSPSTTLRCQYRYDPLDRLVHQTQPDTPVHQRFYCKSRLATEIQGATKHSIIQHDDLLLAQQQHEGNAVNTTLLATDLQRSVLHTLKKGLQPRPIAYSPYGHHPLLSALLSLLGFNGERPDPVTGCYLLGNGYRAFNPVLMRFNSPDNLSPFGAGGLNSYTYCLGDPINNSDPTGNVVLPPKIKFSLSMWIDRARDNISTSFARSIGSPTQTLDPTQINSSPLSSPSTPRKDIPLENGVYQPLSLTDSALGSMTHKRLRPILNKAPPQLQKRIYQLDNSKGQKIAGKLSEDEPSNKILKLAATGVLVGGADWAGYLPIQSEKFSAVMRELRRHSSLEYSPASTFRSFRRMRFDNVRMLINRQRDLNLRGR